MSHSSGNSALLVMDMKKSIVPRYVRGVELAPLSAPDVASA
jgi:hypothetical protein